jgi:membrane protein DedA with SNARE-associated domain
MNEFFSKLIDSIINQHDAVLYIFLFASAVIENLFPPIPGDTITAFGAFLVGTGRLNYGLVFLTTTAGSVAGFFILFIIGRSFGRDFFMKKNYRHFSVDSIIKTEKWFSSRGYIIVLLNRFMPGIRSVISVTAGISLFSPLKVLILSTISAAVWNLIWIHAGYSLGGSWDTVREKTGVLLKNYNLAAGVIMAAIVLVIIVRYLLKKKGRQAM